MATDKGTKNNGNKRRRRNNEYIADWESVDPSILSRLVGVITLANGAVRFGYSRDGGAYSLGIYGDGKPFTEFCPANGNVDDWIRGFIEDYS